MSVAVGLGTVTCKMYERNMTLTLVTNASAIGNNLAVQFSPTTTKALMIAVIHEGYVNVIPVHNGDMKARYIPCVESGSRPRHVSTTVTQVMWCKLRKHQVFVLTSSLGLQIYNEDGRVCKFSHSCADNPDAGGCYARGLALVGDDMLCVGNSTGTIRIFHVPENSDDIDLVECKQCHEKAITDIAGSTTDTIVSADDSGAVSLWRLNDDLQLVSDFPSFGYPCTSIKLWKDYIICAYGSGHIRVFGIQSLSLISEVAAHARWISATDIALDTGFFLSVSEDSFAKVWQISEKQGKVICKFSTQVQDCLLVGGKFLSSKGDTFCVSSYDSCDVICYAA